jgi:hypothetical protein
VRARHGPAFADKWLMSASRLLIALTGLSLFMPGAPAAAQSQRLAKRPPQKIERYQVAAGTALLMKLQTALDSATAVVDQQVDATLWSPVVQDGIELIPVGSKLLGRVAAVERATERRPLGMLTLTFSIVEHGETGDKATMNTRAIVVEATAPPPPAPGKKGKIRPADATLAEGAPLVAVTSEPLVVRIPK